MWPTNSGTSTGGAPLPSISTRMSAFYDWTRSPPSMRETYHDACVPIFINGSMWSCDFLAYTHAPVDSHEQQYKVRDQEVAKAIKSYANRSNGTDRTRSTRTDDYDGYDEHTYR